MIGNVDIASYVDDKTPYSAGENQFELKSITKDISQTF